MFPPPTPLVSNNICQERLPRTTSRACLLEIVGAVDPDIFQFSKILEMQGTVLVIIEAL
jgi:hypothetical protein